MTAHGAEPIALSEGSLAKGSEPGSEPVVHRAPGAVDRVLSYLVEFVAGTLIVAEIGILLAGVVARYWLHVPLIWTDELGTTLFLWIAGLGSVVAFRRGEHMRMGLIASSVGPGARAFLEAFAVVSALAFLALMVWPSLEHASLEAAVTTPALGLSNLWRAAALPVAIVLMIVMAIFRLIDQGNTRAVAAAGIAVVAVAGVFYALSPILHGLGNINLVIFFVGLTAATVMLGVPVAFAFGLATFGYLALSTRIPVSVIVGRMDDGIGHLILLAIPLFVFLGLVIEMTGLARAMVAFLASLLGHVRGGLSYVLVGAMYIVSGISGSKAADMAAVAPSLLPEMRQRGAEPGDLVALLAATGAQTETIPPSLVLITIGSVTNVSIAALFTGGLLPGAVLAITLCAVVWARYRNENLSNVRRATWGEIIRAFVIALPALALPLVIRAAVVEGIATATEVSCIGIIYALLVGALVYRRFDVRRFGPMLVATASLSGAILLIIGIATAMAWGLTQSGFAAQLATTMATLPGGAIGFMAASIVAFIILGSVLEGIPAVVLFGPLLFPVAKQVGIHEVHYAMVVVLSMGIGLFAPPFGVGYYTACAISRVKPEAGMRPIVGYLLALLAGLVVVAAIPWISTGFLKR